MEIRMRRIAWIVLIICLAGMAVFGYLFWQKWKQDEPRRASLKAVEQLNNALESSNALSILETVFVPSAFRGRTRQEQADFVRKALREEVSPGGIAVLKKIGQYGPLKEVFPEEAERWAKQFGVNADDCVAFRASRGGVHAEVVLLKKEDSCRVLRVNNVKQLAISSVRE